MMRHQVQTLKRFLASCGIMMNIYSVLKNVCDKYEPAMKARKGEEVIVRGE